MLVVTVHKVAAYQYSMSLETGVTKRQVENTKGVSVLTINRSSYWGNLNYMNKLCNLIFYVVVLWIMTLCSYRNGYSIVESSSSSPWELSVPN